MTQQQSAQTLKAKDKKMRYSRASIIKAKEFKEKYEFEISALHKEVDELSEYIKSINVKPLELYTFNGKECTGFGLFERYNTVLKSYESCKQDIIDLEQYIAEAEAALAKEGR